MRHQFSSQIIHTGHGISIHDVTGTARDAVHRSGVRNGLLTVIGRHTTTALAVNEFEARLLDDIRAWFAELAPAGRRYRHNDIDQRDCPPDEPRNAHSHLLGILLSNDVNIPVNDGEPVLGKWQSVLLFELDGPRQREVQIQVLGE